MSRGVRYRVLRKIAHGGMAEIFLALQIGAEGFEKPVVLKRILPALASDPGFVRMLVDEAHIVSSLNHTHLVQVLDLGKASDEFFLVLEFVDGWSLEQVRRRARKARLKMPLPLALYVVSALCRALDYVHRRTRNGKPLGIVHRDVNPQNVLLSREGDVKLADFGIAKASGRREKSATGVIKGKFAYMSPEQTIGGELDARSDLFSVGTLLYVLTTGQKPFDAPTDLDVLMQVRKARHEKPSTLVRDFNPEVERFIERALRADRARRWQSAEQMADRLDNILVKLGQPSGPAALKRWLETLTGRDGVLPPGDIREAPPEPPTSTIQLASGDLELQHLSPPEEWDDEDDDEVSTRRETMRSRRRSAKERPSRAPAVDGLATLWPEAPAAAAPSREEATAIRFNSDEGTVFRELAVGAHTPQELEPTVVSDAGPALARELPDAEKAGEDTEALAPDDERDEPSEPACELCEDATDEPDDDASQTASALLLVNEAPSSAHDATASALLLTEPAPPSRPARLGRWLGRAAVMALVLPLLLGGGAYFARPFLPAWLVPPRLVEEVDGLLEQLPDSLDPRRPRDGAPRHSEGGP